MVALFTDLLPNALKPYQTPIWLGSAAAVVAVGAFLLFRLFSRRRPVDPDAGLSENLGEYPPPPPAGTHRLVFEGRKVRIRLVVLAPAGRVTQITADMAEGLLEAILPGLGCVAQLDKPRIKIWPPQLSTQGFAPTFHRHVHVPEPGGAPSRYVLTAGPAKAGAKAILLGLALESTEPTLRSHVVLDEKKWPDVLRVQVSE